MHTHVVHFSVMSSCCKNSICGQVTSSLKRCVLSRNSHRIYSAFKCLMAHPQNFDILTRNNFAKYIAALVMRMRATLKVPAHHVCEYLQSNALDHSPVSSFPSSSFLSTLSPLSCSLNLRRFRTDVPSALHFVRRQNWSLADVPVRSALRLQL